MVVLTKNVESLVHYTSTLATSEVCHFASLCSSMTWVQKKAEGDGCHYCSRIFSNVDHHESGFDADRSDSRIPTLIRITSGSERN